MPVALALGYWLGNRDVFARTFLVCCFALFGGSLAILIGTMPFPGIVATHHWTSLLNTPAINNKILSCKDMLMLATSAGWLVYEYPKRVFALTVGGLLVGVGWALVYSNCAHLLDIINTIGVSAISLFLFRWIIGQPYFKQVNRQPLLGGALLAAAGIAYFGFPNYQALFAEIYPNFMTTVFGVSLGWWGRIQFLPAVKSLRERFAIVISCLLGFRLLALVFVLLFSIPFFNFLDAFYFKHYQAVISFINMTGQLWMFLFCQLPIMFFQKARYKMTSHSQTNGQS